MERIVDVEDVGLVSEEAAAGVVAPEIGEERADAAHGGDGGTAALDATDAPPRDEQGRFVQRAEAPGDGTTETPEAVAALADAGAAPDGSAPVVAAPAVTPPDEAVDWQVKSGGQVYAVPGARLAADGSLTATPEAVEVLHTALGRAVKMEAQRAEFEGQRREFAEAMQVERARQQAVLAEVDALVNAQTEEEVLAWAAQFWTQRETLKREMTFRAREAQIAAREKALQPSPESQAQQFDHELSQAVDAAVQQFWTTPEAKALAPDDRAALTKRVLAMRRAFVVEADQDYPDRGIQRGERALDTDAVYAMLTDAARVVDAAVKRATQHSRTADAAKARNAAALAPSITAPPTAGTRVTGGAVAPEPNYKSADEWKKAMNLV